MTVNCSSQRAEDHPIVSGRQAKLKNGKNKEVSTPENGLKRKLRGGSVDAQEQKTKVSRQDKSYGKVYSTVGVTTRSNVRPARRTQTRTPERSLSVTPGKGRKFL